jgi:coenzyme F420-reducing hydrogenase delta subunit
MRNSQLKIYLFYCSNSFDPAELLSAYGENSDELKTFPLPCSGKIDIRYLAKAFETGADGAAILTCKVGDCRYLEGNLRARKRAEAIDLLLEETGMGQGRITVIPASDTGMDAVIRELRRFHSTITKLTSGTSRTALPVA